MNTTPIENQSSSVNPYTAPKSQSSLKLRRFLTTAIILLVVGGMFTAGALAYWRFSKTDIPVSESGIAIEREEIFFRSPIREPIEPVTQSPITQAVTP